MRAVYVGKSQLNSYTWAFRFATEKPLQFIAGQFIELHLPHENIDDRNQHRWFTIASAPQDNELSITTRITPNMSTFKRTLSQLEQGDTVTITPPMGDFVLPKLSTIPLLFIASGIGVTPFASIVRDLNNRHESRDITMLHHARSADDLLFRDLFSTLENYITLPKTAPHSSPSDRSHAQQRLTGATIVELCKPTKDHYIYLAGPEITVERLVNELTSLGCNRRHIFTDFFHGYDSYETGA